MNTYDFEEFKRKCMLSAKVNQYTDNLLYASNAMCGEAGEFANFVKKLYRDESPMANYYDNEMKLELFDILWYISFICQIKNWKFEDIINIGFQKIWDRHNLDLFSL